MYFKRLQRFAKRTTLVIVLFDSPNFEFKLEPECFRRALIDAMWKFYFLLSCNAFRMNRQMQRTIRRKRPKISLTEGR